MTVKIIYKHLTITNSTFKLRTLKSMNSMYVCILIFSTTTLPPFKLKQTSHTSKSLHHRPHSFLAISTPAHGTHHTPIRDIGIRGTTTQACPVVGTVTTMTVDVVVIHRSWCCCTRRRVHSRRPGSNFNEMWIRRQATILRIHSRRQLTSILGTQGLICSGWRCDRRDSRDGIIAATSSTIGTTSGCGCNSSQV